MHDPMVVAFEIRRPWPKRVRWTGRRWYFPSLITVWHVEPDGRDSGEVCKHFTRVQDADGKWSYEFHHRWKLHVHHWKIQVHPLQELRRRLLTRCAWCGGRSTKREGAVNVSNQWGGKRSRWWRGEAGLFHMDCSGVASAHGSCVCNDPLLSQGNYGTCAFCGKGRSFGVTEERLFIIRGLQTIPANTRDRATYERVCAAAAPRNEGAQT